MKILLSFMVLLCISGCTIGRKTVLPTVLTTSELSWTIPKGVTFKAIQKPAYPTLTEFTVTDQDLAVLSKGNLLDIEKEANKKAVKAARTARNQTAVWGGIASFLSLLGGIFIKNKKA